MRKVSGVAFVLLLLACADAAFASVQNVDFNKSVLPDPAETQRVFRQLIDNPNIENCWRTLFHTKSCLDDIFHSIPAHHLHLSSDCCKAIVGVGEYCLPMMFTLPPPFDHLIPGLVNDACSPHSSDAKQSLG